MKKYVIVFAACLCLVTAGCSDKMSQNMDRVNLSELANSIDEAKDSALQAAREIAGERTDIGEPESESDESSLDSTGGEDEEISFEPTVFDYAYEQAGEEVRDTYKELLDCLLGHKEQVEVSTIDEDILDQAFSYVLIDHPEIYYVDGFSFSKMFENDVLKRIVVKPNYLYSESECEDRNRKIEKKADEILADAPKKGEYELIKYIYEYIVYHTDYVLNSPDNQNLCSVLLNGRSVCKGYAKAMQYLLNRAGIFATHVTGFASGEAHAWVLVKADGEYYYVDPTWGDASYSGNASAGYVGDLPEINYAYLLVPSSAIEKTHSFSNLLSYPKCDAMDDNYYVREGAYFNAVDDEKLTALFENGYANGKKYVEIMCADSPTYDAMRRKLLDGQGIFELLKPEIKEVSYADNHDLRTLTFWL